MSRNVYACNYGHPDHWDEEGPDDAKVPYETQYIIAESPADAFAAYLKIAPMVCDGPAISIRLVNSTWVASGNNLREIN